MLEIEFVDRSVALAGKAFVSFFPLVIVVAAFVPQSIRSSIFTTWRELKPGTVDAVLLLSLILGSLPGIYIGSHLGIRIPEHVMRPLMAGLLILIGGRLMW